jgi:hypothetical protein
MKDFIKQFVFEKFVPFAKTYLVRWTLKFVGSVLVYLGWDTGKYEEFVGGVLVFVLGALLSLLFDKKKEENK